MTLNQGHLVKVNITRVKIDTQLSWPVGQDQGHWLEVYVLCHNL